MWHTAELEAEDANLGHTALDEEHAMILRHIDELRNAIAAKLPAHDQRFLLHEFEMELRENCPRNESPSIGFVVSLMGKIVRFE